MKTNYIKLSFFLLLVFTLTSPGFSQGTQTGDISGTVIDTEGNPLPGVNITLSGPTLIGTKNFVSLEGGRFRFPALPPGSNYELRLGLAGFKTIIQTGNIVNVGKTTSVSITMTQAAIEEEVTVTAVSPTVDVQTAKVAVNYGAEFIASIPMGRDLYNIQASVPGAVEMREEHRSASILGGTIRSQLYAIDGLNMNDPCVSYSMTDLNVDIYEEVEMELGAHQAEVGQTLSAYVNIVTKSGGNKFSGAASFHSMNKSVSGTLYTSEDLKAFGVNPPMQYAKYDDESLSLGGPIIRDRIWFFISGRHIGWGRDNPFAPELRLQAIAAARPDANLGNPLNFKHYNITNLEYLGFLKLTFQITKGLKYMGMFNYMTQTTKPDDHLTGGASSTRTWESIRNQGPSQNWATSHQFNWVLNQNTFLDVRGSYLYDMRKYLTQPGTINNYYQYDRKNDISWGRTTGRQEFYYARKRIVSATLTRFEDEFLGTSHQFKSGAEYEQGQRQGDRSQEVPFPMMWNDFVANDPYYVNPAQKIGQLQIQGLYRLGDCISIDAAKRLSAYVQDSLKVGRLAINVGVRYDYSFQYQPQEHRKEMNFTMGPLLMAPGITPDQFQKYFQQQWHEYNIANNRMDVVGWTDFTIPYVKWITFSTLSPRLGIVYDLFGNGKTALKLSVSRYYEPVWTGKYNEGQTFVSGQAGTWQWYDLNSNKLMDLPPIDRYVPTSLSDVDWTRPVWGKDLRCPFITEFAVGIDQELMKDFSIGAQFIYKPNRDCIEGSDSLNGYDPSATDEKGLIWLPYTVTDPGWDAKFGTSDDKQVTVYGLRSDRALALQTSWNLPEAYKNYWAAILTFNKRMSNRWQLNGSVVYSSFKSTQPDDQEANSSLADNPNTMINSYGPIGGVDRPLQIKLMSTVILPYDFVLSAYFRHTSGSAWQRTIERVYFPTGAPTRTTYSSAINADPKGSRRTAPSSNVDFRVEKQFNLIGSVKLRVYVDGFNILGNIQINIVENPAAYLYYYTSPQRYEPQASYNKVTSVSGVRTYRLGIRFTF